MRSFPRLQVWMVHPHMRPPNVWSDADPTGPAVAARAPKVEYLATLARHSAAENVVRFSPNGAQCIAWLLFNVHGSFRRTHRVCWRWQVVLLLMASPLTAG